jgi:Domain of unknown function (DUF4402)
MPYNYGHIPMNGAVSVLRILGRLGLAAAAVAATPAQAQFATEKVDAEVVVVRPLSFIEVANLHFGSILASNVAGSVVIAPTGARTRTGGVTLAGGTPRAAEFAGMGTPNQRVDISLGSNAIWIYGPGNRMRVRAFVIGSTPTAVLTTTPRRFRIASNNGLFDFPVGATLDVGASQLPGIYTGTWAITLQYQ